MTRRSPSDNLDAEIEGLETLPRPDLVTRWQEQFGRSPPKGASRRFLVLGLAYELQVKRYGGLKARFRRQLAKAVGDTGASNGPGTKPMQHIGPGSRLMREWNGRTHTVDVVDGGYVWNGEHHRSLSAIARAITGARWSGPRFFGIGNGAAP